MKRLLALLVLSVGLGLLGLYVSTRSELLSAATYTPRGLTWPLAALCAASLASLWLAPVVRLRLLAGAQGQRLTPGGAFLAHAAMVFGTAMTPSGTGGGPALMVALSRLGLPLGRGLGIAIQLFILDLVTFGWLIPAGLVYLLATSPFALPAGVQTLAGAAAAIAIAGAVLLSRFPGTLARLMRRVAGWRLLRRFRRRILSTAHEYYTSAESFRVMPIRTWVWLQFATLVAWMANFVLFWALLQIYGTRTPILAILALLSMITLISFFFPTPGASGFVELAVGLTLGVQVSSADIAAPILFWRVGTFYVAYLLGPIITWVILVQRPPRWLAGVVRRRKRAGSAPRPRE